MSLNTLATLDETEWHLVGYSFVNLADRVDRRWLSEDRYMNRRLQVVPLSHLYAGKEGITILSDNGDNKTSLADCDTRFWSRSSQLWLGSSDQLYYAREHGGNLDDIEVDQ